jgi:hypothetical protein
LINGINIANAQEIPGWMNDTDLYLLGLVAKYVPEATNMIELGNFWGRSTRAITDNLSYNSTLYAVDPWDFDTYPLALATEQQYIDEMTQFELPESPIYLNYNIGIALSKRYNDWQSAFTYFLKDSVNLVPIKSVSKDFKMDSNLSAVFIDADHSYEGLTADLEQYASNYTTLLFGHDYIPRHQGVIDAVGNFLKKYKDRYLVVLPKSEIWFLIPSSGHWTDTIGKIINDYLKYGTTVPPRRYFTVKHRQNVVGR